MRLYRFCLVLALLCQTVFGKGSTKILETLSAMPQGYEQALIELNQDGALKARELNAVIKAEYSEVEQLNSRGAQLWNKMTRAEGGEGSRFLATRKAYQEGKFVNTGLQKEISVFQGDLLTFLKTTYISKRAEGSTPAITFHPFLTQKILEILSSMEIFQYVEGGPGFGWHALAFLATDEAYLEYANSRDHRLNKNFQAHFREIQNALRLLSMLKTTACVSWGLWPQASMAVLEAMDKNSSLALWSDQIGHYDYRDPDGPAAYQNESEKLSLQTLAAYYKTCVDLKHPAEFLEGESLMVHSWTQARSKAWWIDVVKAFREFSKR